MRRARWLAPWKDSTERPVIYHCVTRVVERRLAFGPEDKEKFRTFMRMYENFSGCRVLAYCLMCNHVHILLEVPPMPVGGLTDTELLKRLRALYNEAEVGLVAKELEKARKAVTQGLADESYVAAIHERFTYRMHDLGEFMKTLLARFTRWFNVQHMRTGALWESRFKSVLVEEGITSRTMAAYIDLNPLRAGMVEDPALYRWSSYGEAMGGGAKGNGAKARGGLVRAIMAHKGYSADARHWKGAVSKEYRMILLAEGIEKLREEVDPPAPRLRRTGADGKLQVKVVRKGMKKEVSAEEMARLERRRDLQIRQMLRYRVRYLTAGFESARRSISATLRFSDGVAIGSRGFVDGVFKACRERFSARRTSGARKMRGAGAAAAGVIWTARDLKVGVG